MAFKFVVVATLIACARAGTIAYTAPAVAYSAGPALHAAPAVAYETHAAPIAYKSYAAAPIAYKSYEATPIAYKSFAAAPVAYKSYAAATPVAIAAPVAKAVVTKTVDEEYDPNPQYSYSYDVHDTLTGDAKTQEEQRDGDVVRGRYSLLEADGTRRIVEYTADPQNGFNAVVHKEPAQVAVKAVAAAPVVKTIAAAPAVAYKSFAAPAVAAYAAPALAYKAHY